MVALALSKASLGKSMVWTPTSPGSMYATPRLSAMTGPPQKGGMHASKRPTCIR